MKLRHNVEFTLSEFHEMFLADKKFLRLFREWKRSGYKKQFKPSLDRINPRKPYTRRNINMLNWAENRYKQSLDGRNRKGTVLQLLGDKVIARFASQRDVVRKLDIHQGNLSLVLNGKRETVAGYKFIYENKELLK